MNDRNEILRKIKELEIKIDYHNKKYYENDDPEIEDWEYDSLKRELEKLKNDYPEFSFSDEKIGGKASEKFSPVIHSVKMESLHDSFSLEEIENFYNKVYKDGENFVVEPKIDGISLSVEYKNGVLTRASTRGDGFVGEDITENALMITNLPHRLKFDDVEYLEVRGECFISKSDFKSLIKFQEMNGQKVFKNSRNAAAGSIRQKDSSKCKSRNLKILFFNIQQIKGKNFNNHSDCLEYIKNIGLPTVNFKKCNSLKKINSEIEQIGKHRHDYSFQIDGAVIKVDSLTRREELGSTSTFPRWAEAFKYPPEFKKTKLLKIEFGIGRTGILTPVAIFDPISLGGSTISKASLHNEEFIRSKNIKIGNIVSVVKSGDIIPEIIKSEESSDSKNFEMPIICPICNTHLSIEQSECGKIYRCKNLKCPGIVKSQILHFVSRDALDIDQFGEETFNILKDEITDYSDIYRLNEDILKKYKDFRKSTTSDIQQIIPGFSSKIYLNKIGKNLLDSINKSKDISIERFLYGIGIPFVGKETSKILSRHFKKLENIKRCSIDELISIDGIGDITANSVYNFFNDKSNLNTIDKVISYGLNIKNFKEQNNKLKGLLISITGKFEKYSRNDLTKIIENLGATVSSSVSKKSNFLICGEKPGRKLEMAKKMEIPIINEDKLEDFLR